MIFKHMFQKPSDYILICFVLKELYYSLQNKAFLKVESCLKFIDVISIWSESWVTNLSSLFLIYDHMIKQTFGKLVTGWEEMIISLRANGAGVRPELD